MELKKQTKGLGRFRLGALFSPGGEKWLRKGEEGAMEITTLEGAVPEPWLRALCDGSPGVKQQPSPAWRRRRRPRESCNCSSHCELSGWWVQS